MELVEQSFEILRITADPLGILEESGRVCYKSEDKITENSKEAFAKKILDIGHESVLEHGTATVKMITDRGVTHEIVRHRIASYSQESTRYCNYGKLGVRFIKPTDFELSVPDLALLAAIESHYNYCISIGRTPQQARYFLPNGLKTEIVMTANFREWRHFFNLRAIGTTGKPHPQMKALACDGLEQFQEEIPIIFDDLK